MYIFISSVLITYLLVEHNDVCCGRVVGGVAPWRWAWLLVLVRFHTDIACRCRSSLRLSPRRVPYHGVPALYQVGAPQYGRSIPGSSAPR